MERSPLPPRHEPATSCLCRGAEEEDSARKASAKLEVLSRMEKNVHDFAQIRLRLVGARHIGEHHLRSILGVATRLVAAEAEHAGLAARRLTAHPHDQEQHQ